MKKSVIASVMALGMASGLAQAADTPDNEIQFKGNVSTVTCDLAPSVNGSLNPDGVGVIQLGDVKVGGTGKVVSFVTTSQMVPLKIQMVLHISLLT